MNNNGRPPIDIGSRFIQKVIIGRDEECWLWNAGVFSNGYGQFRIGDTKVKAHRVAYFLRHGKLPLYNSKGVPLYVLHKCDNKLCCNPKHLFLGTQKDNIYDCMTKGRRWSQQKDIVNKIINTLTKRR